MGLKGFIARIRSLTAKTLGGEKYVEIKYDPEGLPTDSQDQPDTRTGQQFNGAGNMSKPLPFDYAAAMPIEEAGGSVPVAYLDPRNASPAADGEGYFVGRDADGNIKCVVHLKGDGSIEVLGTTETHVVDKMLVGDNAVARKKVARNLDPAIVDTTTDQNFMLVWLPAMNLFMAAVAAGSLDPVTKAAAATWLTAVPIPPATITATVRATAAKLDTE